MSARPSNRKKRCRKCRRFKWTTDFYAGRATCRTCYNHPAERRQPKTAPRTWPSVEEFDRQSTLDDLTEFEFGEGADEWQPLKFDVSDTPEREQETISHVEEHRLKRRVRDLESKLRDITSQFSDASEMADLLREVQSHPPVRGIEPRERTSGIAEGTPLVLASDWHIEEEVRPEQVAYRNRYNLDISRHRMERFFEATRWAIDHQRQVFKIRDLVFWLGGDIITNYLHPDNAESNLLSPVQAIAYAQSSISDGLRFLLQDNELECIVIPCNDGNHGRLTDKMRAATRIESSIEWLLYHQLQREFASEPRVQFILPTSAFTFYEVYGRTIRFTHGDTVKYGGGVGGIMVPLLRALSRWESLRRSDLTCLGHFHSRYCLPNMMVNGSLIGYNTYAMSGGFPFEAPSQSMRILEPRRWGSVDIPLWVSELEDDQGASY